jgi:hypothetical protein
MSRASFSTGMRFQSPVAWEHPFIVHQSRKDHCPFTIDQEAAVVKGNAAICLGTRSAQYRSNQEEGGGGASTDLETTKQGSYQRIFVYNG